MTQTDQWNERDGIKREGERQRANLLFCCLQMSGWMKMMGRDSVRLSHDLTTTCIMSHKTFLYLNIPCLSVCSNICTRTQCTKPSYLLKRLMGNFFCIKYDFILNYLQAPSAYNVFVGFSFCLCETFSFHFAVNNFYRIHKKPNFIILMQVLLFSCLKQHAAVAVDFI